MTALLPLIGRSSVITLNGIVGVPAKIDTGADSSSVWASDIHEEADGLHFTLFGSDSPYYTGEEHIATPEHYHQTRIVSSTGGRQQRYVVTLPVIVENQQMTASFSLADRATLAYPILLGCSLLTGHFLVDCSQEIAPELHQELIRQKHARRAAASQESRNKEQP